MNPSTEAGTCAPCTSGGREGFDPPELQEETAELLVGSAFSLLAAALVF